MDDSTLINFKAIVTFVKDLSDVFGKMQKSLALYSRLVEKTGIIHIQPIQKHLDAFKLFCVNNRDAIRTKEISKISQPRIVYSERVYIDITHIFKMADEETKEVIWKHLLTISALLDPASNAKKILKEEKEREANVEPEDDFLKSLINKVENAIDPSTTSENPAEVVSSLMSSGVFTDLLGSMQDGLNSGKLDLSKLLGSVNGMMSKIKNDDGSTGVPGMPDLSAMMGMLSGGNINGAMNMAQTNPMMMNMMNMGMMNMGGMGGNPTIEEVDDDGNDINGVD